MNNMPNSLDGSPPDLRHDTRSTPDPDFPEIRIGNDIPFMSMPPHSRLNYYREHAEVYPRFSDEQSREASNLNSRSRAAFNSSRDLNRLPTGPPIAGKKANYCIF